ncbi:MAG: NUDIX hydrolase, partial [Oscillospiraceae bacterium]|nr:NUDIX hydrolase [Oscillospiraceae bacterium]
EKRGKFVSPHLHLNLTFLLEADPTDAVRVKEDENSAVGWFKTDEVFRVVKEARMMPIYRKLTEKLPLR